jgi:hypothetical protein
MHTTLKIGTRVKVYVARQWIFGRVLSGGWYAGTVVDARTHDHLGLRYDVETRYGVVEWAAADGVRAA